MKERHAFVREGIALAMRCKLEPVPLPDVRALADRANAKLIEIDEVRRLIDGFADFYNPRDDEATRVAMANDLRTDLMRWAGPDVPGTDRADTHG